MVSFSTVFVSSLLAYASEMEAKPIVNGNGDGHKLVSRDPNMLPVNQIADGQIQVRKFRFLILLSRWLIVNRLAVFLLLI
jgi:hypothetical protein